jgi:photosystem II stability/assembly factor-like uncharacterized protein
MKSLKLIFKTTLIILFSQSINFQCIYAQGIDSIYTNDSVLDIELLKDKPGNILLAGTSGCVTKSTDFGKSWVDASFDTNAVCYDMSFAAQNTNIGFLAGLTDLFKTTNGGLNWTSTNQLNSPYFVNVNPYYPNIIFVWGTEDPGLGPSHFYRSFDGGTTWKDSIGDLVLMDPVFHPDSINIAYAHSAYQVLKTTDTGETWSHILGTGVNNLLIEKLWLNPKNPDVIYAVGKEVLYKTTNSGINWEKIDSALISIDPYMVITSICGDENFPGRLYIGSGHSYLEKGAVRYRNNNKGLFLTENDGKSWIQIYNQEIGIIEADKENPRNIYCATNFGVIKLVDTFTVTGINNIIYTVPDEFSLAQNYPNPFNPTTNIKFTLGNSQFVILKVFDLLGKEVVTLINENKPAGNYIVSFDGSKCSSGIYFYQLKAGYFIKTRKLVLLK